MIRYLFIIFVGIPFQKILVSLRNANTFFLNVILFAHRNLANYQKYAIKISKNSEQNVCLRDTERIFSSLLPFNTRRKGEGQNTLK